MPALSPRPMHYCTLFALALNSNTCKTHKNKSTDGQGAECKHCVPWKTNHGCIHLFSFLLCSMMTRREGTVGFGLWLMERCSIVVKKAQKQGHEAAGLHCSHSMKAEHGQEVGLGTPLPSLPLWPAPPRGGSAFLT